MADFTRMNELFAALDEHPSEEPAEAVVGRTVNLATRELAAVSRPSNNRLAGVLLHVLDYEFETLPDISSQRVTGVESMLKAVDIVGMQPPGGELIVCKKNGYMMTRFQFLGKGEIRGAHIVAMRKDMREVGDDEEELGHEVQISVLNTIHGIRPLEDRNPPIPQKTIAMFSHYISLAQNMQ